MQRISLTVILVLFLSSGVYAQTDSSFLPENGTRTYKLAWHDEFEGDAVDTEKWYTYFPHWAQDSITHYWYTDDQTEYSRLFHNYDDATTKNNQVFLDKNVIVSDGTCKLITRKEKTSWMGHNRTYSSGVLYQKKYQGQKGIYEIRVRVAPGYLIANAFWLYGGNNIDMTASTEIDVFEFFNKKRKTKLKFESNVYQWKDFKIIAKEHGEGTTSPYLWHIYRCIYDDISIRIYMDDMKTALFTFYAYTDELTGESITDVTRTEIPRSRWVKNDFYPDYKPKLSIIISSATYRTPRMIRNHKWTNRRSAESSTLEIDYVRYFAPTDKSEPTPKP